MLDRRSRPRSLALSSEAQGSLSVCEMSWKRAKTRGEEAVERNVSPDLSKRADRCPAKPISPQRGRQRARLAGMQIRLNVINVGTFGRSRPLAGLTTDSQLSPLAMHGGFGVGCWPNCGDLPYALREENDTSSLDICTQTPVCTCKHAYWVC